MPCPYLSNWRRNCITVGCKDVPQEKRFTLFASKVINHTFTPKSTASWGIWTLDPWFTRPVLCHWANEAITSKWKWATLFCIHFPRTPRQELVRPVIPRRQVLNADHSLGEIRHHSLMSLRGKCSATELKRQTYYINPTWTRKKRPPYSAGGKSVCEEFVPTK